MALASDGHQALQALSAMMSQQEGAAVEDFRSHRPVVDAALAGVLHIRNPQRPVGKSQNLLPPLMARKTKSHLSLNRTWPADPSGISPLKTW